MLLVVKIFELTLQGGNLTFEDVDLVILGIYLYLELAVVYLQLLGLHVVVRLWVVIV